MRVLVYIPLILLLGCSSAWAQREGAKIERWYTYWALGYSHMSYTGKMNGHSTGLSWWEEGLPVYDREYALGLDLFGLYLPLKNRQTLIGAVYNLAIDHRSEIMVSSLWEKWKGHQLSVSTMHFFKSIGHGPFIRADLGFGWITGHNQKEEHLLSAADSGGLAGLFGFGYSFPIEDLGGRILLNLDYFITPALDFAQLDGDVRGFSIRVGGVF